MTTDRFLICLPFTLKQEGGNSNDPHDPGGRTHEGITQREYDLYRRGKGMLLQSDYLASEAEVQDIYLKGYWLPHCPDLAPGVDLSFFDQCVNEGPLEAIKLLQRALEVPCDGMFGPMTDLALRGSEDAQLIKAYAFYREGYYRSLKTYVYFGKDWIRRTQEIEVASAAMVTP